MLQAASSPPRCLDALLYTKQEDVFTVTADLCDGHAVGLNAKSAKKREKKRERHVAFGGAFICRS